VLSNALEKHCSQAGPFVDNIARPPKKPAFAHSPLWICRRFSTVEAMSRDFLPSELSQTGVRARFLAMSLKHVTNKPPASDFDLSHFFAK